MKAIVNILKILKFLISFILIFTMIIFLYLYYDSTHLHPDIKGLSSVDIDYFLKFYAILLFFWLFVYFIHKFLKIKLK